MDNCPADVSNCAQDESFKLLELPTDIIRRIGIPHVEQVGLQSDLRKSQDLLCHLTIGQFLRCVNKQLRDIFKAPFEYSTTRVICNLHEVERSNDVYEFVAQHASYQWVHNFKHNRLFINAVVRHLLCNKNNKNGDELIAQMSTYGYINIGTPCHKALIENIIIAAKNTTSVLTKGDFAAIINYNVDVFVAIMSNLPPQSIIKFSDAHEWVIMHNKNDDKYHQTLIDRGIEVNECSYHTAVRLNHSKNAMFIARRLKEIGTLPKFITTVRSVVMHEAIPSMIELSEIFGVNTQQLTEMVFLSRDITFICEFIKRVDYKFTSMEILRLMARYRTVCEFQMAVEGLELHINPLDQLKIIAEEKHTGAIVEFIMNSDYMPTDHDIDQMPNISRDKKIVLKNLLGIPTVDSVSINVNDNFGVDFDDEDAEISLIMCGRSSLKPNMYSHLAHRFDALSPISETDEMSDVSSRSSSRASSPRVFWCED
ncbi:hypothetical protein F-VV10_0170 [Faustovirus]|nr:hypothetical protein F-VV10_0170 [Faustovirus]